MFINGPETRPTPHEYQNRLNELFGVNQFGDPHIIIVWGQSKFHRMGNVWRDSQGNERKGYRDRYQCHAMPCWVIMRWKPPEAYSSPDVYYARTYDPVTDLHFLGEYPWRGRYEVMQPLISKEMVDGKLVVEHFPLSHYLIDTLIPMILAFQELSYEEQQAARQLAKEEEEKKENAEIAEKMIENLPAFYNPVSFAHQGCKTSVIDRKMHQIQKVWDRMTVRGRRPQFSKSFAQGERPLVRNIN